MFVVGCYHPKEDWLSPPHLLFPPARWSQGDAWHMVFIWSAWLHHRRYFMSKPSIFPTYEFVGYPFTTRNPPFFRRPIHGSHTLLLWNPCRSAIYEGLEPLLENKTADKSFVQRTLGGLSRHLFVKGQGFQLKAYWHFSVKSHYKYTNFFWNNQDLIKKISKNAS